MKWDTRHLLLHIRVLLGIVILGLVLSGITAFPLLHEVEALRGWMLGRSTPAPIIGWIGKVHEALLFTQGEYPFLSYGTDWLAFGHLVIAIFFIGPWINPVRNAWVVRAGQIACLLVIPTALICGEIRGIPLWWRMIDSAFGVFGLVPLYLASHLIQRLAKSNGVAAPSPMYK